VPKVLGLAELLAQPASYGYELQPLAGGPRFEMVELPGQVELALAADLIDMDEKALQKLNAGHTRWATDPQGPHRLLVPFGAGEELREKLADFAADDLVRWHRYEVEDGDNLESIAKRYGVNVALLREVNDLSGSRVRAGQALRIPRIPGHELRVASSEPAAPRQTVHHVIRSGDSLSRIAAQHGVRVSDLTRWNDVSVSTILRPGRTLVIHRAKKGVATAGI
jgi:membrane-bound lytic murein transglycosylase D